MPQQLRSLVAAAALVLSVLAVPSVAQADSVSVRVETTTGPLVPATNVGLPSGAVAPSGAADGQNCPGNSVIGALHTATNGDWSGVWSDTTGWGIQRVMGQDAPAGSGRKWVLYLNYLYLNESPCQTLVKEADKILIYPSCDGLTTRCFPNEPLTMEAEPRVAPGARLSVQVWQTTTKFDNQGIGVSQRFPSLKSPVSGPDSSATTDPYFGVAILPLSESRRGEYVITASSSGRVPDRMAICVTDGQDGYCGTSLPPFNPFDPLNFCATTGDDGECNTVDKRPPVGRITEPAQAKTYSGKTRTRLLKGTVDRDPSEVIEVRLRLKRQSRVLVTKFVKKKVRIKKGKKKGKLVKRRVRRRVRVTRCYSWNASKLTWTVLRSCKVDPSGTFKADGDEVWSYEFLSSLPVGNYTLDAQAVDGKGNVDTTPELGRNRVAFVVK